MSVSELDRENRTRLESFVAGRAPADGMYVEVGEPQPTMEALRWSTEILSMLGSPLPEVATFVRACQCSSGAFAMRDDRYEPDLAATYYAVRVLALTHRPDLLPDTLSSWLRERVFADNGSVALDVDDLFYAVRAYQAAGLRPDPGQVRSIAAFVDACEVADGGFGLLPGEAADVERTYCCVQLRGILHGWGARQPGQAVHRSWVERCAHDGAVYWTPESARTSLACAYWGTHAAVLLDARFPWDGIAAGVEALRCADGAYGDGGRSTLWHTYCSMRVLDLVRARPS